MVKYIVDLYLNNGKSVKNIQVLTDDGRENWVVFKLRDKRIMRVPVSSIACMIDVECTLVEDEDQVLEDFKEIVESIIWFVVAAVAVTIVMNILIGLCYLTIWLWGF